MSLVIMDTFKGQGNDKFRGLCVNKVEKAYLFEKCNTQ